MASADVMMVPATAGNLEQYIRFVQNLPELDATEERALARRYRDTNDLEAAWQLVTSHLRYVVSIARGYTGYGLPQEDLIQEGNIGLMKAVKRFDPERGVRLLSYAVFWIRSHIHDYILNNWRMVKFATTKARRKLFYNLRSAKQRLEWLRPDEARRLADHLDVSEEDVVDMEANLYGSDEPFDLPVDAEEGEYLPPSEYLAADDPAPESLLVQRQYHDTAACELRRALATLDDRSREILQRRWLVEGGNKATLQELGDRFGVSAERIRQLESAALKKLWARVVPALEPECARAA